jgi:peptidoglycan/LPS O-acetylase OafA/YrhL
MTSIRTDIQVLRGLAILLVLLYHAGTGLFEAGYLGVDIFFVISGFLITSLIKTQVENCSFSFQEFYIRRAKRLLPAAYVTFFIAALLAPVLLTSRELADFQKQMIGALTLTGNFVLLHQTGYFEGTAELKPLLHVWSLAIEEQYYLLIPALLAAAPRRFWMLGALSVCFLSLFACLIMGSSKPAAAFYLLPTRAWELGIGSVGALWVLGPWHSSFIRLLFWPSIIALIVTPALPLPKGPPAAFAVLVCSATLVVILRGHSLFHNSRFWTPMARLGNISYSLYLVHWPLFAFLNNCWIGEIPCLARITSIILSITLAYLLYSHVEKPIRQFNFADNAAKPALAALSFTLTLALIPLWPPHSSFASTGFEFIRRVNHGFGEACEYKANFSSKAECRNSDQPAVLVWGDSFAMHLVPGLTQAEPNLGIIQATRSVCGPMLEMAPLFKANSSLYLKGYNLAWTESCIEFNASVIEYLRNAPSVNFVVLSSLLEQYLDSIQATLLDRTKGGFAERPATAEAALEGLRRTANAVRSLGKRVVVIAPPPSAGFDIGICLERLVTNKVSLGRLADCTVPITLYHKQFTDVLRFLDELPRQADIPVISFDNYLCGHDFCKTFDDNKFIYRDKGHLSYDGSEFLAKEMRLPYLVRMTAR